MNGLADANETSAAPSPIKEQFNYNRIDIADRLVFLSCKSAKESWYGSGFIAEMAGKKYIFINQHIILGAGKIGFTTANGIQLRPRRVELAETRNIARLELETDTAFQITQSANMDDPVAVFGNDDGESTGFYGTINGVGADLIETTADFSSEYGGAPVLNTAGEVIGIASHVRESRGHAMKEGTKFENRTRHFCQRLSGVKWRTVNWKRFNEAFGASYRTNEKLVEDTFDILIDWQKKPFNRVSIEEPADRNLNTWVQSHNSAMLKYGRSAEKRKKYSAYSESLQELSDVCTTRSRKLYMMTERRELTGFLRNEIDAQASALEYAVKYIKRRGDTIHTFSD
ncbi:serine protease [Pontiellaceae bacterium B12227]|nr:serine protease [Pontiellaceae bacterium B12227]